MASIKQLDSRKWKATVTLPDGRQRSKTDPLRKVVATWASSLETDLRRGDFHDDREAKTTTLTHWHERWVKTRVVSENTRRKNATHWRIHVEPRWGRHGLAAITREEVRGWVADMQREGVGPATIEAVVTLLGKMLADAVEMGVLKTNVAARVKRPPVELRVPFFWSYEEARAIIAQLDEPWALMVELDFYTGLRMGEMRGLRVEQVDLARRLLHVTRVETRQGPVELTKGRDRRSMPLPPALLPRLAAQVQGRGALEYVFAEESGRPVDDRNFAQRIFEPARVAAGVRRGTPHDMRHTAASWLVMQGVDLYRVQALLGHKDAKTTQRYAHLAPDAFDRVTAAWGVLGALDGPPELYA